MPQQRRRNRFILGVLALGLLAGAALTVGPAQADSSIDPAVSSTGPLAVGSGPYYAVPAWDQSLACSTSAICPRFLVLTNWGSKAVLDKETGLVWEKSPASTTHTWSDARVQCTARTIGTRKGWRLPSVHELTSLLDPSEFTPALPAGHPFLNFQSAVPYFWSATTIAANPANAWIVNVGSGIVGNNGSKTTSLYAWCVRGGMNADQY